MLPNKTEVLVAAAGRRAPRESLQIREERMQGLHTPGAAECAPCAGERELIGAGEELVMRELRRPRISEEAVPKAPFARQRGTPPHEVPIAEAKPGEVRALLACRAADDQGELVHSLDVDTDTAGAVREGDDLGLRQEGLRAEYALRFREAQRYARLTDAESQKPPNHIGVRSDVHGVRETHQ